METATPQPATPSAVPVVYRFEDVSIDPRQRLLLRGGRAVHVEPKVLDLILYLIENRWRVVLHETLLRDVWGGVSVAPTAITQCVAQARRTLGDSARAPRCIRTYHRLGYRFVAEIEDVVAPSSGNVVSLSTAPRAESSSLPSRVSVAVG